MSETGVAASDEIGAQNGLYRAADRAQGDTVVALRHEPAREVAPIPQGRRKRLVTRSDLEIGTMMCNSSVSAGWLRRLVRSGPTFPPAPL